MRAHEFMLSKTCVGVQVLKGLLHRTEAVHLALPPRTALRRICPFEMPGHFFPHDRPRLCRFGSV